MSKNKRKRRLKEEDFKKKKLKVGKKLPMPDNLTRTSFKARNININQQNLKQDGSRSETNFKGQNLKELLRLCSHYNTQAREGALLGLTGLFQSHPGILKDNLNAVLQQVLSLITDLESSVCKRFLALISVIFKSLSETEISPFFANIIAYLCAAMTHLNESIRLDSLKFLDLCLEFLPQLVKANPKNIVLNFINVISFEKSDIAKRSGICTKTELKAKVMSQKMQLEVLSQLNRLLYVVFGDACQSSNIDENGIFLGKEESVSSQSFSNCTSHSSSSSSTCSNVNPTLLSNFSLKMTSSECQTADEDLLQEFISSLAPVLFEYWVECCPAEFSMNLVPIKKVSVSLQIMKEILQIFVTLIECLKKNNSVQEWFRGFLNNMLFQFDTHFIKVFPLSFTFQQSGKKSKVQSVESITDVQLNLLIARLLSYYIDEIQHVNNLPRWAAKVLTYLQDVLAAKMTNRQQSKIIASDIKSLGNLVKIYVLNLPEHFDDQKIQLLENMYKLFKSLCAASNTIKVWLDFVAEIVKGARNQNKQMITVLVKWLKSLLKIVNKDISQDLKYEVFFICKSGILQRFPHLTEAMTKELPRVFAVEIFSRLSEKIQRIVIEILYHSNQVPSQELYSVLAKLCNSGCLPLSVFKYLLFVIHQLVHSHSLVSNLAGYLSFFLSITMGHTQDQLEHIQSHAKGHPNCYNFKEISEFYTIIAEFENNNANPQITKESWERGNKDIEIICQLLTQSEHSSRFLELLKDPLCQLFSKYAILPLDVVYRLLYVVKNLLQMTREGHGHYSALLAFVGMWCAVIWNFLLKVWAEFGKVNVMQTLANHLKTVISELCKSSEIILKNMLDLFIPSTLAGCNIQLTCQVLTEMLKEFTLTSAQQSVLKDLYKNLESASNGGTLNSQVFSDFKYQYQSYMKRFLIV